MIPSMITLPGLEGFPSGFRAIVIGATGGIGAALTARLSQSPECGSVTGLSRSSHPAIDLLDEAKIADAAAELAASAPYHLIVTAVGILHGDGLAPEKALKALDPGVMARSFAINAIGPALVIKHFAPLLPKHGRCVLATLSARVGSIGDNRLGGWHSYRASKAALNQFIKTSSVEIARNRPDACVLALHPGTVATGLSSGFNPTHEVFTPDDAARRLLAVMSSAHGTGRFLAYDGSEIPW